MLIVMGVNDIRIPRATGSVYIASQLISTCIYQQFNHPHPSYALLWTCISTVSVFSVLSHSSLHSVHTRCLTLLFYFCIVYHFQHVLCVVIAFSYLENLIIPNLTSHNQYGMFEALCNCHTRRFSRASHASRLVSLVE